MFLSDGGEDIRQVCAYLHLTSEHVIDLLHLTMRLTVLQQQTKGLTSAQPETGTEVSRLLGQIKHLLWDC